MIMKVLILVFLAGAALCGDLPGVPPQPLTSTTSPNSTTPHPTTTTQVPNTTTPAPHPTTTTHAPNTTTTHAPNTTTTTTHAPNTTTTTHAPNTTTTHAPNTTTTTTTHAPNTTTTTTMLPPNITTPTPSPKPGPNTTTTPTPTSTVAPSPTPVPDPQQGKWAVKNTTSNVICIIADMAIQISVEYKITENKTGKAVLDVPKDANATGICGNETQDLMLEWTHKKNKNYTSILTMTFKKETKEKKVVVQNVTLQIAVNPDDFPSAAKNVSDITVFHNGTLFGTTFTRSYKCTKQQEVSLFGNSTNSTVGTLKFSHVQLEAFHETNSTDFGAIEDCERSTDIVPITVGCALVGLVAVVLIGYLVGRRRSQARGYLSM